MARKPIQGTALKGPTKTLELPSRLEVLSKLSALAEGAIPREEAYDWARTWTNPGPFTDVNIDDEPIWEALKDLEFADAQHEPGVYFYGAETFRLWLDVLEAAPPPAPKPVRRT